MNTHKYIARIVLQAETPLFVGSGEKSLVTDALVQRDYLGLPMIPATSLLGVLRHSLEDFATEKEKEIWNDIFGYHENKDNSLGGRLRLSSAYFVLNNKHKIAEKIDDEVFSDLKQKTDLKQKLENLPTRQHVKITEKGVADTDKNALFDNEVMYKGSRFVFEMELSGEVSDESNWKTLLNQLQSPFFRIGQGTRNGYGKLSVYCIKTKTFDFTEEIPKESKYSKSLEDYINYNSSLNADNGLEDYKLEISHKDNKNFINYTLNLKPDDFFMFSKGSGDDEVDNIPTTEEEIVYTENGIKFVEKTVIQASSVKGAIAHRTQFHYNKKKGNFIDNDAVSDEEVKKVLFGIEKKGKQGQRGIVIFDDIFIETKTKIFNHVAIDRFTGGAINGALFNEKVAYFEDKNERIKFHISVMTNEDNLEKEVIGAFEDTLKDICKGLLPLGGMTTKGNGFFSGSLEKNGTIIYPKTEQNEN